MPQVVDDGRMVLAQRRDLGHRRGAVALLHGPEDPLEGVRGLAHRRNDDKEVLLVVDDLAQVAHPLGILHRGSSEFVYFHVVISNLIQPNFLLIIAYFPTGRYGTPMFWNRKAYMSAASSIRFEVGLPAPWPAFVSMRISTGASPA